MKPHMKDINPDKVMNRDDAYTILRLIESRHTFIENQIREERECVQNLERRIKGHTSSIKAHNIGIEQAKSLYNKIAASFDFPDFKEATELPF